MVAGDAVAGWYATKAPAVLATLIRVTGSVDLAEDAAQDAVVRALETWPRDGVPDKPRGCCWSPPNGARSTSSAGRHGGPGRRPRPWRWSTRPRKPPEVVRDDLLRLVFTCCHPTLALEAQVALALRTLGGCPRPRSPAR
jgi:RNA polymerase sigma-70 factor (ECF subfamily)